MKTVAFLEPKNKYSIAELNTLCHEKIDQILKNPNVHIIISENFSFAIKYLEVRRFRNCTIYHKGQNPVRKFPFKLKGGFTSFIEIEACLEQDSSEQINFE